jgi:hypothetical protein
MSQFPTGAMRKENPFYAHFPELRTMLRDFIRGRSGSPLVNYILDDRFMREWSTKMRYSHGKDIREQWIQDWATQARQIVASIGT